MLTPTCRPCYAPIAEFMLLFLQLHYAYRLLLTYLDRWRDFTSPQVDGPSGCHVVHAHTALPQSQQTPNRTPPAPRPPAQLLRSVETPMRPANAARYTIANEFTRRRTQVARNPTVYTHHNREQRAHLRGIASLEASSGSPNRIQSTRRRAAQLRARKLVKPEQYGTGLERLSDVAHRNRSVSGTSQPSSPTDVRYVTRLIESQHFSVADATCGNLDLV